MGAGNWKVEIINYYEKNRRFPSDPADLGPIRPPASDKFGSWTVTLGTNGALTVTMNPEKTGLEGTIIFKATPDKQSGSLKWDCTEGTLDKRYRGAACRPDEQ